MFIELLTVRPDKVGEPIQPLKSTHYGLLRRRRRPHSRARCGVRFDSHRLAGGRRGLCTPATQSGQIEARPVAENMFSVVETILTSNFAMSEVEEFEWIEILIVTVTVHLPQ